MNPVTLTAFLAPFLPVLLQLTAEGAASRDRDTAQAIWQKLQPQVAARPSAQEAADDVAHHPDDPDAQAALRLQLKKILEADSTLAGAIDQLMQQADGTSGTRITQTVTGNNNQTIGQVTGGQVFGNVTGGISLGTPPTAPEAAPSAPAPPKTILILAANPRGTSPLQLGEEVRDIQAGLDRARQRDRFVLVQQWAVSDQEVRRALLDYSPHIVHFSGHGMGTADRSPSESPADSPLDSRKLTAEDAEASGLVLENAKGQPQLVSGEALAELFALFADRIECIVLNACYSATQAQAIAQHIPYVVGMKQAIGDLAAIQFSVGFYDVILAGKSIEFAYQLGCNAIRTAGIPEYLTPVLHNRS